MTVRGNKNLNKQEETNATNTNSTQQQGIDLAQKVASLTSLVETLITQNKTLQEQVLNQDQDKKVIENVETIDDKFDSDETQFNIDSKELFKIMSLTVGGLNLKTNNVRPLRLVDYGSVRTVTFEDLRVIVDYNHRAAQDGKFFILSEKAVKALYLDDDYNKIVNRKIIDGIMDKSVDEIRQVFTSINKNMKKTIAKRIVDGIVAGDSKYNDRNKIKFIGDLVGQDLYAVSAELEKIKT